MEKKDEPLIVFIAPQKPFNKFINKYKNKVIFGAVILAIFVSLILIVRFHTQIKNQLLSWNNQFQEILVNKLARFFPTSIKSKTYDMAKINSKIKLPVKGGDTIVGHSDKYGVDVTAVLTPGKNIQKLITDQKGSWVYKIPKDLKEGDYRLTALVSDKQGMLISIKSYQIKVTSSGFSISKLFEPRKAQAQESVGLEGEMWDKWVAIMREYGIYPAKENGEVILYSKAEYQKRYLGQSFPDPVSLDAILNSLKSDKSFFSNLLCKLLNKGYVPVDTLSPYFPEIKQLVNSGLVTLHCTPTVLPVTQTSIDQTTLEQYIREVAGEMKYYNFLINNPSQLAIYLIVVTDPIFGASSIIKWATVPGEQMTFEDRLNALGGVALFGGSVGKLGLKLTGEAIKYAVAANDVKVIRTALEAGEAVPLTAVETRAAGWVTRLSSWESLFNSALNATRTKGLMPVLEGATFWDSRMIKNGLLPLIREGKAFVVDPSSSKAAMDNLWAKLSPLINKQLGGKVTYEDMLKTINKNWVVVVKDEDFIPLAGGKAGGFTQDMVVVLPESTLAKGEASLLGVYYHEFVHVISHNYRLLKIPPSITQKLFIYNQQQADSYGRLMSTFYEIGTDYLVHVYFGIDGPYRTLYPNQFNSWMYMINKLSARSGGAISWDNFARLALSKDDITFIGTMIGGRPGQLSFPDFLSIIGQDIDLVKLERVLNDYIWIGQQEARNRLVAKTALGAGGVFVLWEAFAKIASGEELPSDYSILYLPLEFSEDVDLSKTADSSPSPSPTPSLLPSPSAIISCQAKCSFSQVDSDGQTRCYEGTCTSSDCEFNKNCVFKDECNNPPKQLDCPKPSPSVGSSLIPSSLPIPSPSPSIPAGGIPSSNPTPSPISSASPTSAPSCEDNDCRGENCAAKGQYCYQWSWMEGDCSCQSVASPSPEPKKVSKIYLYGQEVDLNNPYASLEYNLPGVEGVASDFGLTGLVQYSDGTTKSFVIPFKYRPLVATPTPDYSCDCISGRWQGSGCDSWLGGTSCGAPAPTTDPCPGKHPYNDPNGCDPACCSNNSQCPAGQSCNFGNGGCQSGLSCNPVAAPTPDYSCDCISGRWQGSGCDSWLAGQSCGAPAPTADSCPGKHQKDYPYACDPACCSNNSQCPAGQSCNFGNGGCQSGLSCNPNTTVPDYSCDCINGRWQGSGCDSWLAGQSCGAPAPTADPCLGKHQRDYPYTCDPACCSNDSQCPTGQSCNFGNGGCQSGLSCNPTATCQTDTNRYCFDCRRTAIVSTNSCTGLGTVTEVTDYGCNDASMCASPSSCPGPYTQCGGTAGLWGLPANHTFYITPICDDSGGIIEYRKVDLGRLENQCGN